MGGTTKIVDNGFFKINFYDMENESDAYTSRKDRLHKQKKSR